MNKKKTKTTTKKPHRHTTMLSEQVRAHVSHVYDESTICVYCSIYLREDTATFAVCVIHIQQRANQFGSMWRKAFRNNTGTQISVANIVFFLFGCRALTTTATTTRMDLFLFDFFDFFFVELLIRMTGRAIARREPMTQLYGFDSSDTNPYEQKSNISKLLLLLLWFFPFQSDPSVRPTEFIYAAR